MAHPIMRGYHYSTVTTSLLLHRRTCDFTTLVAYPDVNPYIRITEALDDILVLLDESTASWDKPHYPGARRISFAISLCVRLN